MKSLQKNSASIPGRYNLGNSLYKQNNFQEAVLAYDSVRNSNPDEKILSDSYYNLGNSFLKMSMDTANTFQDALPASIEAYKNALRTNPDDTAAKYNLSYAMNMMEQQQQQQQQDQQQNQDNNENQDEEQEQDQEQEQEQEQEQDQQDQEQDQEQQQQENQQNQNDQQQQQQQQQQPKEISKEDAQRMLEALQNDEKNTLEKLKLQQVKGNRYKSEKDW